MRTKPHSDKDPKPPEHVWPPAWWEDDDVACTRCHRKESKVKARNLSCVTDEHTKKAEIAGHVFTRSVR